MRKRSKYRPKGVIMNPIAYVMESMTPVAKHDNFLIDLKIKNHMAMTNLTQGKATREDMDTLIPMANFVEALYRMGFGRDYATEVHKGLDALHAVSKRGAESGRFLGLVGLVRSFCSPVVLATQHNTVPLAKP